MDEGKLTHVIQRKNRWGPNLNICALVMDGKFRVFTGDDATPQSVMRRQSEAYGLLLRWLHHMYITAPSNTT